MMTAITIFTGTASILGFIYIYFFSHAPLSYKKISGALFVLATLWSAYILIVPESSIVNNVSNKLAYYQTPTSEMVNDRLLIQRGSFSLSGLEALAIEFQHPFLNAPKVEVININGNNGDFVPEIRRVTPHQVTFKSKAAGGLTFSRSYNWVARGIPLKIEQQ